MAPVPINAGCQICDEPVRRGRSTSYPGHPRWFRCVGCGSEALRPQPDDARLAEIYGPAYYQVLTWESPATLKRAKGRTWRRALRAADVRAGQRLLDVGCAHGGFAALAAHWGLDAFGVDLHEEAIAIARRQVPGATFACGEIEAATSWGLFDVITMFDFLEHVRDPSATLRRVASLLADPGQVVILTPRVDSIARQAMGPLWPQYREEHLHLLSLTGIGESLRRAGLRIVHVSSTVKYASSSYLIGHLAYYSPGVVKATVRRVRPITRLRPMHWLWPMRFGEMTVIARRA